MNRCIEENDIPKLTELLRQHDQCDVDGISRGLQLAAEKGHSACARLLLAAGANPNMYSSTGFTPIIIAARYGHPDIVSMMIDTGSHINKATLSVRATALHWAASNGHFGCVKRLIDRSCNLEAQTIHGRTALMLASHNGHEIVAKQLIDAGCAVNETDCDRSTALHHAVTGSTGVIRVLLDSGAGINDAKRGGETAASLAVMHGQSKALKCLVAAKCDLGCVVKCMGLLHWAAYGGNKECCQILIDKGLDCNSRTSGSYYGGDFVVESGVTPLMLACRGGCVDAVDCLIKSGAHLDESDSRDYASLHYCARYNDMAGACAKLLLENGAHPEWKENGITKSESRITPLHISIRMANVNVTKELLRANCKLDVVFDGATAFELALKKQDRSTLQLLLAAGFRPSMMKTPLRQTIINMSTSKRTDLLQELHELLSTAPSLKHLSRICIRKTLKDRVLRSVHTLPLPNLLLRYVGLIDFEYRWIL